MAKWFRRLLPRKGGDDPGTAAQKQTSINSSVTESTHHSQHVQGRLKSRTKEEIADINAKYAPRTGMPVSSEYQLMVGGDPYKVLECPHLTGKKVEARRFCAKYSLDDQVLENQRDMSLEDVFKELRKTREAMLRSILGRVGQAPVIEPPFNFSYGCNIVVGDNFYANVNLRVMDSALVVFGNNVLIGPNVTIVTELHPKDIESRINVYSSPVVIEDNCWIAVNAVILPGVTIGKGSVIGAGSVVAKDIPPGSFSSNRTSSIQQVTLFLFLYTTVSINTTKETRSGGTVSDMDKFYVYTYAATAWLAIQGLTLAATPRLIVTLLLDDTRAVPTDIETYLSRSLGLALLAIAMLVISLSGLLPLTSPTDAISVDETDARAPFATSTILITTLLHGALAFYNYTCYISSSQTALGLGMIGSTIVAATGVWCLLFGTGKGRGSYYCPKLYDYQRTAQDDSGLVPNRYLVVQRLPGVFLTKNSFWCLSLPERSEIREFLWPFINCLNKGIRNFEDDISKIQSQQQDDEWHDTLWIYWGFLDRKKPGWYFDKFDDGKKLNPAMWDLPGSLSLGSTLPSGFDHNDPQSFQGFSHSIEHATTAFPIQQTVVQSPRPGNFDPRDTNANNPRYQAPPLSRPNQGMTPTASNSTNMGPNQTTQRSIAPASSSRSTDDVGELTWMPPLNPSLSEAIVNRTPTPQSHEAAGSFLSGPGAVVENKDSHFGSMKIVPNPPDLDAWRDRLFNVDEPITLTEDQFKTYFPHVDNVYSHRSTQKYKRKPFVSHYWDCRLKGRPPGTPKSDDPNKKKRKRTARERDLCDVKIKITEHYPGTTSAAADSELGEAMDILSTVSHSTATAAYFASGAHSREGQHQQQQPFGILTPSPALPAAHPGSRGQKYYTIQRVNGNGGNGKTDGVGGGHRHTLEESDRVKKNSVHRHLLKASKEKKDVWILGAGPQLFEMEIGSVMRATCFSNIWMNSTWGFRFSHQATQSSGLIVVSGLTISNGASAEELKADIAKLVNASHVQGPFFLGPAMSYVDIQIAPWILRLSRVLKPFRGWSESEMGTRWANWVQAVEENEYVMATTSSDEFYLDSYAQYFEPVQKN
ncbi:Putative acetyltransferase C18B11,09c [Talaromyces islandicus]|uniref:Putative acetyltransferase C18B11,09c n=1 Tax=Talaromyces islandicus TaxID=28573 RepID=A0A0U1LR53_TALIS|nr:Putative acetyltransferase C18B11,09c [Talaromyces islandicus]